jgi:hypothetical protein
MLIHRGDKGGPVIATADLSQAKEGISVIEFQEPQSVVHLAHVRHRLPLTHANTYFTFGGKKYHWKAHAALIEDDTRICLAAHHTINLGGPRHRLGSIVLTNEGMKMRDLVAVTLLVERARSDEEKLEVRICTKYVYAKFSRRWRSLPSLRINLKALLNVSCSDNNLSLECKFLTMKTFVLCRMILWVGNTKLF